MPSPIESPPPPFMVSRFAAGSVLAIATGVLAEWCLAEQRDSMTWGLCGAFLPLAFLIGTTQRRLSWVVGVLLLPSYWCSALSRWPSTSTAGVGSCFSVLFAIPHGMAAHLGMCFGMSLRARRMARRAGHSGESTR